MSQTVAPLDGMWLNGFVPQAQHFGFYQQGDLVGYYCLNDEGFILQFYLDPVYQDESTELFNSVLNEVAVKGVFVSTAEPQSLAYCLDYFKTFETHTLMYRLEEENQYHKGQELAVLVEPLNINHLDKAVSFAHIAIDAPQEWLNGYFHNLIERKELFGSWIEGHLIATGECRAFDEYQTEYADLGMIVGKQERNKGVATRVLKDLVVIAKGRGLEPICSTEKSNLAAQKSIERTGFVAKHRILKFNNHRFIE